MDYKKVPVLFDIKTVFALKSITSFFLFSFDKGYRSGEERHSSYELIFVMSGEQRVMDEGDLFVLGPNQIFIHDYMSQHYDETISDKATLCVMTFDAESELLPSIVGKPINLSVEQAASLISIFNYGFVEFDMRTPWFHSDDRRFQNLHRETVGATQVLKNKLENFFISLFNSFDALKKKPTALDDRVLTKIINALEEEKMNPFSLEVISRKTDYSRFYLCRYFKSKTGMTITNYFYNLKVDEAQKLLLSPTLSIKEICTMLGFETVQYFSTVFKRYTGSSPAVWRTIYRI